MTHIIDRYIAQHPPLLPIVTVTELSSLEKIMSMLVGHGIGALEITLRTPQGLTGIRQLKQAFPQSLIAAGSVTTAEQLSQAVDAGADLIITPGITKTLLETAQQQSVAILPGVSTASDILLAIEYDCDCVKLFPAEALGGIDYLKALAAPFPQLRFCPTGGIDSNNAGDYLDLPQTALVGGSWLINQEQVENNNWDAVDGAIAAAIKMCVSEKRLRGCEC